MTPAVFLAHILAFHLHVPEPVTFSIRDLRQGVEAQITRYGPVGMPTAWAIEYDRVAWNRYPKKRLWVIAHEACHAVYDHAVEDWDGLQFTERGARHARVEACAAQVLRDCAARRLGVMVMERPVRGRWWLARVELTELLERGE